MEEEAPTRHGRFDRRGAATLALLTAAYLLSFVDRQILALMVGPLRRDLRLGDFDVSLLQGFAFSLFYCMMGLPMGWLADRYRRIWLISGGVLLWSLATIYCGLASGFAELFVARMVVGFGEATLLPAGVSILTDRFDERRQVRAISLFMLGGLFGAGVALICGGAVIELVQSGRIALPIIAGRPAWQQIFVLVGLPGLALAPLILLLPEPARRGRSGTPQPFARAMERLWRDRRALLPYLVVAVALSVVSFAGQIWFATHLIRSFGFGAGQAGLSLGLLQLSFGIAGNFAGVALTERFARRNLSAPHMRTAAVVAVVCAATIPAGLVSDRRIALALWAVALIGQSGYYGSMMGAIQQRLPNEVRAVAAAVTMIAMTLIGLAGGTGLVGALSDAVFPGDPRAIGRALAIVSIPCLAIALGVALRVIVSPAPPVPQPK